MEHDRTPPFDPLVEVNRFQFERTPTIPTADEILDVSFRRAAKKRKEKHNKDRANEEFVRAVTASVHDRLVSILQHFPDLDTLPPFYQHMVEILYGIDRMKKALGAVGWAAWHVREKGYTIASTMRRADVVSDERRKAVARIASIVHQIDPELRFLNDARNVLRKLPHVSDEFTVVVAGYPNVGKSSFIRAVSSAAPDVAGYPFTTKGVIIGHRETPEGRIQLVDTPGILDRPAEERNPIERQALTALMDIADVCLFLVDPSEHCGFSLDEQHRLLAEVRSLVLVPVLVACSKADIVRSSEGLSMSSATGEGVDTVLDALLVHRPPLDQCGIPSDSMQ
ncbi:MAG: NOG1 family protein [Methanoregulaceae archaeon]